MKHTPGRLLCIQALTILLIVSAASLEAEQTEMLTGVEADSARIDVSQGDVVTFNYRLREEVKLSFFICDLAGTIVRTLVDQALQGPGDQAHTWDGLDDHGRPCRNGVYVPIIKSSSRTKGLNTYNPTAKDWGAAVPARDIRYVDDLEAVTFSVDRPAFARLRVGLKEGGPVYKTLAPWQLWQPGSYQIAWDGMNKGGFHNVLDKAHLAYSFDSFALPPNGVVLQGGAVHAPEPGENEALPTFPLHPPTVSDLSYFALEPTSHRNEPEIALRLNTAKKAGTKPVLSGRAMIGVEVSDPEAQPPYSVEGAELLLYIDDEFVVETPVTGLPMEIGFDTAAYGNGAHLVTINLLTGDDRAGVISEMVVINN